ncbi:MAG: hypothetical protein WBD20_19770 [Pirellulaceae bacterium]
MGFLHCKDDGKSGVVPYIPREGDIVLLSHRGMSLKYVLGRSSHPVHSGLITRRPSGDLAFFEVGGGGDNRVVTRPIAFRFGKYLQAHESTVIWVRQIRRDIALAESVRITRFVEAQQGKKFAKWYRFARLALPGRPMPQSHPNQKEWFCSELVTEALREGRLIDDRSNPSRLTPHELFHDKRIDLSPLWEPPKLWTLEPRLPTERPHLAP